MISKLTNPDVIEFIQENLQADPAQLVLSASKYPNLPVKEIAIQIGSRKRAVKKLPEWAQNERIIFPPKENLEQASSEKTATFKADQFSGRSFLDLTGGSGVDTYYLSKNFSDSIYVEPSVQLCELARHNFHELGADIRVVNSDANAFLTSDDSTYDLIYLDPSRRSETKQRVVDVRDYQPNVIELLPDLIQRSKKVLIKTSPMIDIKQGVRLLQHIERVICVAVDNEMKEVLFELSASPLPGPMIEAVHIKRGGTELIRSDFEEESETIPSLSAPLKFIYEPNPAIRKAGLFNVTAAQFQLSKLDRNTHLYTSDQSIPGFPGRCFSIEEQLKVKGKALKPVAGNGKINVISKNFPLSTNQIKKKYNLKDGGDEFLIFTSSNQSGNIVLHCTLVY